MVVKVDGKENKDFGNNFYSFYKFLKENTHSGKVDSEVEVFKGVEIVKDSFHWIMSTKNVDRDLESVDQAGWMLDNYLKNPVVLWSHDYKIPAIGYAENVKAETFLEGDIKFNEKEIDPFGWSIGQRVKSGALRAGSVGFRVDEVEFIEDKESSCNLIYRKQELLEFSICCVPSNPFALYEKDRNIKTVSYFEKLRTSLMH